LGYLPFWQIRNSYEIKTFLKEESNLTIKYLEKLSFNGGFGKKGQFQNIVYVSLLNIFSLTITNISYNNTVYRF